MCRTPPELNIDGDILAKQEEIEVHSLLLLDQSTFEGRHHTLTHPLPHPSLVLHVYQLCPQEHVLSMASCVLVSPDSEERLVYIVGTALVNPEEKEATIGRVLVLQVNGGK